MTVDDDDDDDNNNNDNDTTVIARSDHTLHRHCESTRRRTKQSLSSLRTE